MKKPFQVPAPLSLEAMAIYAILLLILAKCV